MPKTEDLPLSVPIITLPSAVMTETEWLTKVSSVLDILPFLAQSRKEVETLP